MPLNSDISLAIICIAPWVPIVSKKKVLKYVTILELRTEVLRNNLRIGEPRNWETERIRN